MRAWLSAAAAAARAILSLAVLLFAVTTIALARSGSSDPYLAAGAINPTIAALSPDDLKAGAADKLEAATGKGGGGYAFEVVQTSTITAQPGGPLIDIPNPTNAREIIGQADQYVLNILLERGIVRPDGFWSEIRAWAISAGEPDFDKAELRRSALVRDGVGWRNDREGWYRTEVMPGVGLDPLTASLLPRLLRETSSPTKEANELVDGAVQLRVDATGEKADIPGVVAADGLAYTKLEAPIEFSFDGAGRLVGIRVIALNTNMTDFDLVVETVITITYDGVGGLPQPDPTYVPANTTEETGR